MSQNLYRRRILLLIKLLAVAVYVGGASTVFAFWMFSNFTSLELSDPRRDFILRLVSRVMVFIVVPAPLLAIAMGIALLRQYPGAFFKTRWLQVKIASLLIVIPSSHFFCRHQFRLMVETTDKAVSDAAAGRFLMGMIFALVGSLFVVIVSRLKPRMGQSSPAISNAPALAIGERA